MTVVSAMCGVDKAGDILNAGLCYCTSSPVHTTPIYHHCLFLQSLYSAALDSSMHEVILPTLYRAVEV